MIGNLSQTNMEAFFQLTLMNKPLSVPLMTCNLVIQDGFSQLLVSQKLEPGSRKDVLFEEGQAYVVVDQTQAFLRVYQDFHDLCADFLGGKLEELVN